MESIIIIAGGLWVLRFESLSTWQWFRLTIPLTFLLFVILKKNKLIWACWAVRILLFFWVGHFPCFQIVLSLLWFAQALALVEKLMLIVWFTGRTRRRRNICGNITRSCYWPCLSTLASVTIWAVIIICLLFFIGADDDIVCKQSSTIISNQLQILS